MSKATRRGIIDDLYTEGPSYPHYGGTPPHQRHSSTSRAAAEKAKEKVPVLWKRVMWALDFFGPLTDAEIIRALGPDKANSIRPRRVELVKQGKVVDSGEVRDGSTVWALAPTQWDLW